MTKQEKKVSLSKNFFIKSSSGNLYLIDLNYKDIIFEPYELTKEQYNIIKELNGSKTIKELEKISKNKKKFYELIRDLKEIGAISYCNKIRQFNNPSKGRQLYDVHFEFTKQCNFNCKHCYQEKYLNIKDDELTIKEIRKLIDKLKRLNIIKISLSGGEPFLKKDLKEVCSEFKNNGIKVDCIFTNGVNIKKSDIAWLKKESIHLFISLDGPTPNSHGIIRDIPIQYRLKIFKKIISNIKKLTKAGVIIKINTCIYKNNIYELEKMYVLLKKLKIVVWRMTTPKFVGRYEKNMGNFNVNSEELSKYLTKLLKKFLMNVKKTEKGVIVPLDLRISNIFKTEMLTKTIKGYSKNDSSCDYQRERITIKPNGDIVPCGLLINQVYGNIKKNDIKSVWNSKNLQKIKNIPIKKIVECDKCKYKSLCGGGCRTNSLYDYGDLFHKDKSACECMKILFGPIKDLLKKRGVKIKISKNPKNNKKVFIKNTEYSF